MPSWRSAELVKHRDNFTFYLDFNSLFLVLSRLYTFSHYILILTRKATVTWVKNVGTPALFHGFSSLEVAVTNAFPKPWVLHLGKEHLRNRLTQWRHLLTFNLFHYCLGRVQPVLKHRARKQLCGKINHTVIFCKDSLIKKKLGGFGPLANYAERPPLVGEVVPTFADRGCRVVSTTDPPPG
jgi:hypothetical protein